MEGRKPLYKYPDQEDHITRIALEGGDPYPGYWVKSERAIIDRMIERVASVKNGFGTPSWLMDAGCGWGRLLPPFEGFFDHVLAVEPDAARLEGAKRAARGKGFEDKTVFVCAQLQDLEWPEDSIDVVICSHIIQHVRTELVPLILDSISRVTREKGTLFLTTSHSIIPGDYHAVAVARGNEASFTPVSQESFDRVASGGGEGLPVRFYAIPTLESLLYDAGFQICETRVFQVIGSSRILGIIDRMIGRDRFANATSILKNRMGTNVFLAARKAGSDRSSS